MKKGLLTLFFFMFFISPFMSSLVLAQSEENPFANAILSVTQNGMIMIILLLISFVILVLGTLLARIKPKAGKWIIGIGLCVLLVGIFGIEIAYILQNFFGKNPLPVAICSGFAGESENLFNKLVCVFTGLEVTAEDWTSYLFLLIFAIIVPFAIICLLFYVFMPGILEPNLEKALAVLFAIVAYRFLLAALFFELLSYGIAGLGILIFDVFLIAIVFKALSKFWRAGEYISTALGTQDWADLSRLMEERQNLIRARDEALKMGDMKKVRQIEQMLGRVEKDINRIRRRLR